MEAGDSLAYLLAAGLAFLAAQLIKYALNHGMRGTRSWRLLYMSGRMPSAHSATMFAISTVIALRDGVESGLFALALVLTLITVYDAMMSRRSTGEQGLALHRLLKKSSGSKEPLPYLALGHTPLEVAAGSVLGVVIGFAVAFFITK